MLLAGLTSGFSHCALMCGPFVVMQASSNMANDNSSKISEFTRLRNSALLPYHIGRIITYTMIAAIATIMSSQIMAISEMKLITFLMLLSSGIMFLIYALTGNKINFKIPSELENIVRPLFKNPRGFNGLVLGLLLGFIPCGMMFAAILAVSSFGDLGKSIPAILLFGLGTIPGLFSVSFGTNVILSKYNIKNFQKIAVFVGGIILITTAYNIYF